MITKPILVTVVTSLLFCSGCAAKNRWFSRRDYSEMQDPFMESEAVAAAQGDADSQADKAGRARLTADAGSSSSRPGTVKLPGPKPIQRTGVEAESKAFTGRVATASYPQGPDSEHDESVGGQTGAGDPAVRSYQGPALSDFLRRKQAEASTSPNSTFGGASDSAGSPTGAGGRSPSRQVAVTPEVSEEAESFGSFLQQKSNAVNTTNTATQRAKTASQLTTQAVQESEAEVSDFSAWAEQRKSLWSKEGTETASNAKTAVANEFSTAALQTREIADNAVVDFNKPDFDTEELAQPLIQKKGSTEARQTPGPRAEVVFDDPKKPVPAAPAEENPFENPFDFGENDPVAGRPKSSATPASPPGASTPRKALDDSFQMDSGWKPANITRP